MLTLAGSTAMLSAPAVAQDGRMLPDATDDAAKKPEVPSSPSTDRSETEAKSRLDSLQRQHDDLEFKKRTKEPFTSDRSLRHQLRRNEAQQGWEKSEQRRLEYEQLRRERSR